MSKLIKLTQGKTAIVDDEDYEWLMGWKWSATEGPYTCYAKTSEIIEGKKITIRMHRMILGAKHGDEVDHRNHNGLDNQRSNIRIATKNQNMRNRAPNTKGTSKFKGVYLYKRTGRWAARIRVLSNLIYLGSFQDEIEAARAYDKAALKCFGEFALTNTQAFGI